MRHCLACSSEYLDEPLECRSCGAATVGPQEARLFEELRERMSQEALVAVATLENPVEEAIIGRLLVEAQIPYSVHGGHHRGPFPGVGGAGYGSLLVLEDQVERAAEVVRRYRRAVVEERDSAKE